MWAIDDPKIFALQYVVGIVKNNDFLLQIIGKDIGKVS